MGMQSIEHVVVVMMENRSFDNLLGWLYDDWPDIAPQAIVGTDETSCDTPLNDVQKSLLATALKMHRAQPTAAVASAPGVTAQAAAVQATGALNPATKAKSLTTYKAAFNFLHLNVP